MKTSKSIIWGLCLIIIGFILGANTLGILKFDIFFDGWWTLFIIIPSIIGLFTDNNKIGNIVFLIIGVLLLLACQEIIDFELLSKLILPIIIILIGISLLLKNIFSSSINESIKNINASFKPKEEYNAIFSGQDIKLDNEEFKGTTLNAIFGGIELDLRGSIIKEDVVINVSTVFGGIDIFLPDNVKVKISSNSFFGGVENMKKNEDGDITIYINATCIFGGIDLKD